MNFDGKTCCPECGSGDAVAKSVAWDALAQIPPKTEDELARLRKIAEAARTVAMFSGPHVPVGEDVVQVKVALLHIEALRALFGFEAYQ